MASTTDPDFGFGVGDAVVWTDPDTAEDVLATVTAQDNETFTLTADDGETIAAYFHECRPAHRDSKGTI